jgi:hypothetical protein
MPISNADAKRRSRKGGRLWRRNMGQVCPNPKQKKIIKYKDKFSN